MESFVFPLRTTLIQSTENIFVAILITNKNKNCNSLRKKLFIAAFLYFMTLQID